MRLDDKDLIYLVTAKEDITRAKRLAKKIPVEIDMDPREKQLGWLKLPLVLKLKISAEGADLEIYSLEHDATNPDIEMALKPSHMGVKVNFEPSLKKEGYKRAVVKYEEERSVSSRTIVESRLVLVD